MIEWYLKNIVQQNYLLSDVIITVTKRGMMVIEKKNNIQNSSNDVISELDDTKHNKKGRGILASAKDINLPPAIFAEGCKFLQAAAIGDLIRLEAVFRNVPKIGRLVDFRDYDRRTALHIAASEGHLHICKFLVEEKDAKINRSDRWGGSPLDDAHRHQHVEIAAYLRSKGAVTGSSDLVTNFIRAAASGDLHEVKMITAFSNSFDVNMGDYDKRTALHLAAGEGFRDIVEFLCLQPKINVNAEDRWGYRPIDDAIQRKYKDCIGILERYGGSPSNHLNESDHSKQMMENKESISQLKDHMKVEIRELEMIDRIGGGAFGDIYKCRWKGILVAAKCIKNAKIIHESIRDYDEMSEMTENEIQEALEDFRKEMGILSNLRHPNICMLLAYSTTTDLEIMISELMKCSLLDVFKANIVNRTTLSNRTKIAYAQQLAQGMTYLHGFPIIHRDLKPANLLIDHSGCLKIADFGLAKIRPSPKSQNEQDQFTMTGETGSYRFMAPEVFRHESYDERVDVYSFAMILYNILNGKPPWHTINGLKAVTKASREGERPILQRHWDLRLCNLLKQCWDEAPSNRPSFQVILDILSEYSRK